MAEQITLPDSKERDEIYASLLPQVKALTAGEMDEIANLSNITAALKEAFGFLWIGFYLVKGEELVLGPFQGPVACTRINKGKGVCGAAWETRETQLVPDVDEFPGHIACSSLSRSEIVVPILRSGNVVGVLDIDSSEVNDFGEVDRKHLEDLASHISGLLA